MSTAGKSLDAALRGSPVNALASIVTSQKGCSSSFEVTPYELWDRLKGEYRILQDQLVEAKKGKNKKLVLRIIRDLQLKIQAIRDVKQTFPKYKANPSSFLSEAMAKVLNKAQVERVWDAARDLAKANQALHEEKEE